MSEAQPEALMSQDPGELRVNTKIWTWVPIGLIACILPVCNPSVCNASELPTSKDSETVKKVIQTRYPEITVVSVRPAEVSGLYEIFTGDSVVYADRTGNHLLVGSLVDTRSRIDLSAHHLDELNSVDFDKLPFDQAIKTVHGEGKQRLAVFADPDCPYCRELEKELAKIDDVTIYTFLYPIPSLHPGATEKARAIWCAADRAQAWRDWMIDSRAPPSATCSGDSVAATVALAGQFRISSTPTMFLETGGRLRGAIPAGELEKLIRAAHPRSPREVAESGRPAATHE